MVVADDEHAPDTIEGLVLTTTVRYPIDSRRESHWRDETGTHFEVLRVSSLRPGEMLALVETLKSDTCTLHTLYLDDNEVGADGARALAEALQCDTCTLHTLELDDNGVGADGERAIDEAQALCRTRRRCRHHGLLRAIVMLAILRKRACEAVFHPKRLRREGVFDRWAHDSG